MAKNRAAAEKYIVDLIDEICPGSPNTKMYTDLFAKMSDDEFDELMRGFKNKTRFLRFISAGFSETKINIGRNYKILRKMGIQPDQRIWFPGKPADGMNPATRDFLSPNAYTVGHFPYCRQAQMLASKISAPTSDHVVDHVFGQATGASKGAKVSAPELHVMKSKGLINNLVELMKVRGGDRGAYSAANAYIDRTGEYSLKQIEPYSTGVQATAALDQYFRAAHIKTNLTEK